MVVMVVVVVVVLMAAAAAVAHRSGEHVRLGLPARRAVRVRRRRRDTQRQTAAVRYVTLFGVRRLHVQPLFVFEHRVHHRAQWQRDFRLVMVVQLRLVQQTPRAQHHRYVSGTADGRLRETVDV